MSKLMVGVGVITYNRLDSLRSCMAGIAQHTSPKSCRVMVADDGSTDGTQAWCQARSIYLVSGPNQGIAVNKNRALHALQDCDFIFLVEDDVRILRSAWTLQYIQASQATQEQHFLYNRRRDPEDVLESIAGHQIVYHHTSNGFMMFLTQQVIQKVGGFDPRFGQYGFEHHSYTYRVWKAGLIRRMNPHLLQAEPYLKLDLKVKAVLPIQCMRSSVEHNHSVLAQTLKEVDAGQIFHSIPS